MELRASIKKSVNVRKLPPSRDVLCFSYYLEKYINDLGAGAEDYYHKLTFYPLLLWWKLTTIIPMRASEFCTIERDCLSVEDSKTYLNLPRIKNNTKNVQVYDRVLINSEMAEVITEYLSISEEFGSSETLVSFRSIAVAHSMLGRLGTRQHKRNMDYLNNAVLNILIQRFYSEVLEKKYGVIITKENWVRPNTTRHIAFISLMMQGISPVEIARLGGHVTIEAQYHYSGHVEYWIDTSVMKLLEKYKYTLSAQEQPSGGYISRDIILATVKPGTTEAEIPLEIGYCSDEQQRCQTDIPEIEGCMFGCNHWKITRAELREKQELIAELVGQKKKKVHELFAFIRSMHKHLLKDEFQGKSVDSYARLKTTARQIEHEVEGLAKFGINPFTGGKA